MYWVGGLACQHALGSGEGGWLASMHCGGRGLASQHALGEGVAFPACTGEGEG